MTTLLQEHYLPIADYLQQCLLQCGTAVHTIDSTCWEFTPRSAVPLTVTVRLSEGWLRLRAPLSAQPSNRPEPRILNRMLGQNAELAGGAKFILADDPPLPCLAADILLDEDENESDLGARISEACHGFSQASVEFSDARSSHEPRLEEAKVVRDQEQAPEPALDVVAVCKEVGWPVAERPGNHAAVELDVPGHFYQAFMQPKGREGLHLSVNVAHAPHLSDTSRHAISVLLLDACHLLRMARAVGGATGYRWEVSLDRVTSARQVEYALGTLSMACRLSAREVAAFQQDEPLARRYLLLRGRHS